MLAIPVNLVLLDGARSATEHGEVGHGTRSKDIRDRLLTWLHTARLLEGRRLRGEENSASHPPFLLPISCMFWMLNTGPPHPHPPAPPLSSPPPTESLMWGLLWERWLVWAWALLQPDHWPTHPPLKRFEGHEFTTRWLNCEQQAASSFKAPTYSPFPQKIHPLSLLPSVHPSVCLSLSRSLPHYPSFHVSSPAVSALISIASQSEENDQGQWGARGPTEQHWGLSFQFLTWFHLQTTLKQAAWLCDQNEARWIKRTHLVRQDREGRVTCN